MTEHIEHLENQLRNLKENRIIKGGDLENLGSGNKES
jgi:hypothetical protein